MKFLKVLPLVISASAFLPSIASAQINAQLTFSEPLLYVCAAQGHPLPGIDAVAHVYGKTTPDTKECCDSAVAKCEEKGWADCRCAVMIPGAPAEGH